MKYLVVYAHPDTRSFNHAILETISEELRKKNKDFKVRDLYQIGFNPVLSTKDLSAIQDGAVPKEIKRSRITSARQISLFSYFPFGGRPCRPC